MGGENLKMTDLAGSKLSATCASHLPYGLAVMIPGFHLGGPDPSPGMGTQNKFIFLQV